MFCKDGGHFSKHLNLLMTSQQLKLMTKAPLEFNKAKAFLHANYKAARCLCLPGHEFSLIKRVLRTSRTKCHSLDMIYLKISPLQRTACVWKSLLISYMYQKKTLAPGKIRHRTAHCKFYLAREHLEKNKLSEHNDEGCVQVLCLGSPCKSLAQGSNISSVLLSCKWICRT